MSLEHIVRFSIHPCRVNYLETQWLLKSMPFPKPIVFELRYNSILNDKKEQTVSCSCLLIFSEKLVLFIKQLYFIFWLIPTYEHEIHF